MQLTHKLGALVASAAVIAATALGVSIALPGLVGAASNGAGASGWHIGYYNPSGRALSLAQAAPGSGVASLNFTNQANTALLIANGGSNKAVLGNQAEHTITANVTISGVTGAFTYGGEPDGSGGQANVRLYFESTGGPFAYTNYWWTDSVYFSPNGNGTYTLTAQIDPTSAQWSDWNGQPSTSNVGAFNAAASSITGIGLSFGGGYFFENGVGTTDGTGTLTLNSFTVG
jgi:hypothetical protein